MRTSGWDYCSYSQCYYNLHEKENRINALTSAHWMRKYCQNFNTCYDWILQNPPRSDTYSFPFQSNISLAIRKLQAKMNIQPVIQDTNIFPLSSSCTKGFSLEAGKPLLLDDPIDESALSDSGSENGVGERLVFNFVDPSLTYDSLSFDFDDLTEDSLDFLRLDFFGPFASFLEVGVEGESGASLLNSLARRLPLPLPSESIFWYLLDLDLDGSLFGDGLAAELSVNWCRDDFGNSGRSLAEYFVLFRLAESAKLVQFQEFEFSSLLSNISENVQEPSAVFA